MVKQITLTWKDNFTCDYYENDKIIKKSNKLIHHKFDVQHLPSNIKIKITPWKIQPQIRFDGHLVNYGLAGIKPWDHMIEFNLNENYLEDYFQNIIEAKRQYLSRTGQNVPDNMESYVGVDNAHPEIVDKIKELIK